MHPNNWVVKTIITEPSSFIYNIQYNQSFILKKTCNLFPKIDLNVEKHTNRCVQKTQIF